MTTVSPTSNRLERISRALAVAGCVLGASWGVQWTIRVGDPFGKEGLLQLMFSLVMAISFFNAATRNPMRRFIWANAAFLSALWALRCYWRHYPLGVPTFLTTAGLAMAGFLVNEWRRRVAPP